MKTLNFFLPIVLATTIAAPVWAQDAPANIVVNGDFEKWHAASDADKTASNAPKFVDDQIADGFWFNAEAYERAQDPKFPFSTTIARDTTVKHGGEAAVRIENGAITDIGSVVLQPIDVEPNTKYTIKVWVKGENLVLEKGSPGPTIWNSFGPTENFWANMKTENMQLQKSGSFDWMPIEIPVTSAANSGKLMILLQLRRASGQLWFDDLEVIPGEKVEAVPEF